MRRTLRVGGILALLTLGLIGGVLLYFQFGLDGGSGQMWRLRTWFADPAAHSDWQLTGGERCPGAPMLLPTDGYVGFERGDSFRPGHTHSGFDIFSPDGEVNLTPIYAAYDGYLIREADWRSTVILRHEDFPGLGALEAAPALDAPLPGDQIWTYYTHMASADGETSFVSEAFPPGTYNLFVAAGTLLGYQGNWSGTPSRPTGLHLHFSVVKSTQTGGYANETDAANTYDPGAFLGLVQGEDGVWRCGGSGGEE